ncbi:MAG: antitermination protein NusG [Gammaproteobacteria bacterium]|nr:antitermination protein NusG [Gammaproteobacteria bacterium]MDH3464498.1 antitermination protein NusG [Gammaproteobacteria bacterium]
MLTKILYTIAVAVAVYLFYRGRGRRAAAPPPQRQAPPKSTISPHLIAYSFLGILAVVSAVLFYLNWSDDHRVIEIRVTNSRTGDATSYQAQKMTIEGRSFETLDGRAVTLGADDRIEMLEPE